MLTPADKAGGRVAGAREDPCALNGPGSLSPDGWIYGGLGGTPPGANPTPRGTQWFPPRRPPGARDRPLDRDRGESRDSSPPTPPDVRVRIRRFGGLSRPRHRDGSQAKGPQGASG